MPRLEKVHQLEQRLFAVLHPWCRMMGYDETGKMMVRRKLEVYGGLAGRKEHLYLYYFFLP